MAFRRRRGTVLAAASALLALAASTTFILLPTGTTTTATSTAPGSPSATVVTQHTLLEHEGPGVLFVLAVPVLVAAIGAVVPAGWWARPARTLLAFLLWAFAVLGAASVGLFYVPAAIAMTAAAFSGAETPK